MAVKQMTSYLFDHAAAVPDGKRAARESTSEAEKSVMFKESIR